jgi:hypothetical protein
LLVNLSVNETKMRAYCHQGHGPRADQTDPMIEAELTAKLSLRHPKPEV